MRDRRFKDRTNLVEVAMQTNHTASSRINLMSEELQLPATLNSAEVFDASPRPKLEKFKNSVSLLTWGYNEELLVEDFLNRAVSLLENTIEDWEIIFVNDGSTDKTGEILNAYALKEPRVKPIHNEQNLNVGKSCRRAIMSATKEYFFWQTVDWSYDLSNLRIFLELLKHYSVVVGIRPTPIRNLSYVPLVRSAYRVKNRSDTIRKAVISLTNYYLLRILFGVPFQDFQNVSFYPSKLVQSSVLRGESSFLSPECLLRTYEKGASFLEVPIKFLPRTVGKAKGTTITSIFRSVQDIFKAWLLWGWKYRINIQCAESRIYRIAEPFHLNSEVIKLAAPLFEDFR